MNNDIDRFDDRRLRAPMTRSESKAAATNYFDNATAEPIMNTDLRGVGLEKTPTADGSGILEGPLRGDGKFVLSDKSAEEVFSCFLEIAPDAVVVTERDGRIIRVNAQAEKMFQYSCNELIGRDFDSLIPERFRQEHVLWRAVCAAMPVMRPTAIAGPPLKALRRSGEEFPVEVSLGLVPVEDDVLVCCAIRDMTTLRKLEDDLRAHKHQLEFASQHKDDFLAMLTHDLRNPLAAICMAVQVLRISPPSTDPDQLYDIISRQSDQMLQVIDDLVDASRMANGKVSIQKVPVELGSLISQAIEAVQPLLNSLKFQPTVSLPDKPVNLLADPVRLVEVFTSLLSNSAKNARKGGQILLTATEEGDEIVIEVQETGIGNRADILPIVFDPFTQVKAKLNRSEGGTGIGLGMVATWVGMHDGTVRAYSDGLGQGTRFVVRLPIVH